MRIDGKRKNNGSNSLERFVGNFSYRSDSLVCILGGFLDEHIFIPLSLSCLSTAFLGPEDSYPARICHIGTSLSSVPLLSTEQ